MAATKSIVPVGQFTTVTSDGRQIVDLKKVLKSEKIRKALESIRFNRAKFASAARVVVKN